MREHEETARLFLETSRAEAHMRAQLRDSVLAAFLAATAAIFGFALTKDASDSAKNALLVVPYLSFGVASLLSQHNLVIHTLSLYQIQELRKFLGDGLTQPPLWENSAALRNWGRHQLVLTVVGQIVVLVVPSAFALLLVPCHMSGPLFWGYVFGWSLTAFTFLLLVYVFAIRFCRVQSPKPSVQGTDSAA
jgi:hypothetical protein